MKIENETLYINKTDLDHILDMDLMENDRDTPPSELFLEGLEIELQMNGLENEMFNKIVINLKQGGLNGNDKSSCQKSKKRPYMRHL